MTSLPIRKQIYMEGGYMLSKNTIGNGVVLSSMWWLCVWWFGFLNTLIWSIVIIAVILLYIKLSEMNNRVY